MSMPPSVNKGCPATECNTQFTKLPELTFRALLTEGGAERLEVAAAQTKWAGLLVQNRYFWFKMDFWCKAPVAGQPLFTLGGILIHRPHK